MNMHKVPDLLGPGVFVQDDFTYAGTIIRLHERRWNDLDCKARQKIM